MNLGVLIVDDEPLAREKLRTLLTDEPGITIVGECDGGEAAIAAIERQRPDLVFLDVQMPEVNGFDVIQALDPATAPAVIFVTAYDRYALQAFDVHALDYLLKPFDRERFGKALAHARAELGERRGRDGLVRRLGDLLQDLKRAGSLPERFVIRSTGRVVFLRVEEVEWIEAAGNYVEIHAGGDRHLLRETMKSLEARLDPARFVRVHRSAIVNVDHVQELRAGLRGESVVVLRNGGQVPANRAAAELLERLLDETP